MTCIYDWFSSQELNDHLVSTLQGKPFVHLPEEKDIVCVNEIVIELSSSLEIKPFLYKSPSFYGQFYELFQQIGCKRSVMFCHYASILQKIKHQCKENEMSVPERAIVKSAFKGLIQLPLDEDTSVEEVSSVFIPTQQLYLKDSKQVIISNKKTYEHRLKGKINLDLCVELSFLDIQSPSLEEACTKWPNHLRPVLLADVVTEEVCMEDSLHQRITNSKKARKLERFLHSNELVTALCRLIKHQSARKPSQNQFDPEKTEVEIAANLRNVTVVEYPALKTVLKYKGKIVEGSERLIEHHIQKENGNQSGPCTFFFNDKSKSENVDIPKILHGIISLLKICTTCLNVDSIIHLTLLIQSFEYPYKLHSILDDLHIQQYGSPQATLPDYFPKPGTYVEEQFIPFLEQGIIPFQDFEFEHVAMELEDDDDGLQNPVYIYVKILREEVKDVDEGHEADNFERIYIVETGKSDIQTEKVPIYRLYRFVRRDTGNEIEVYTGKKQKQQIPIDEQCRKIRNKLIKAWKLPEKDRKRIVRRILLEWHPDKNRGNEEYCTKVFQYIQVILSRLENGEPLGDDVDDEMRRGKSQFSQSSSAFYENVFKRARTYARAYYDNFEAYSRSERTGDFTHSNSATVERQDHGEAQRWLRQAKHDFQAALEMFPVASGASSYNWVCYICHQVCEKALKAAHYSRDANNVPEGVFLPRLAITSNMMEQASLLETRLGAHGRLRYPDALSRPRIPSDIYSMDDAEFSIEVARKILEMVEEYI
ncbi:sacsin-like [Ruditapes philippinarum]|uniref:sacsin-like n=1 Tax=Ruditapes philippinarum TaxID=129788 RepID=UPI00295AF504|nr:sacsin-like [Ruditapes philippinarum]